MSIIVTAIWVSFDGVNALKNSSDTFHRGITPIILLAVGHFKMRPHQMTAASDPPKRAWLPDSHTDRSWIRNGNIDFLSLCHGNQPTDPSICNSTSRFSSSAYSIGSSRLIGSTKPRTIMPMASSSERPRLIR